MKTALKILLPVLVLAIGGFAAKWLIDTAPKPKRKAKPIRPPVVRVVAAQKSEHRFWVTTQGTVRPRTETALVPEVSGRVVEISPALAAGGFFETGETLFKLDPTEYRLAVIQAEAKVAKARSELTKIEAEAEAAHKEWKSLGNHKKAGGLVLKEPQLAEARASLASANAALEQDRYNLARTVIKAPFAGRVRQENVDLGQYVSKGAPVAYIYAVDYAEVRLPLPDEELAYVDLPLTYRGGRMRGAEPRVILSAEFAGRRFEWEGKVVRTEGEIDPKSRMVVVVARVKDPYGSLGDSISPPLASGLFVEARIEGVLARDVFVLPRAALEGEDHVVVVGKDNRLHWRKVKVMREESRDVVISAGLLNGDRVCVTRPATVVENMRAMVAGEAEPPLGGARANGRDSVGGEKRSRVQ